MHPEVQDLWPSAEDKTMAVQELATAWPIGSPAVRVLVMVPTYNEAENVDEVLRRVRVNLPDADVLVIDDASPDGTSEIAEKLHEELGQIEVLRRPAKSGLGSAYRAGFRWGLADGYDVMVEMDADLSHDPRALPVLIDEISQGGRPRDRVALRSRRFDPRLEMGTAGHLTRRVPVRQGHARARRPRRHCRVRAYHRRILSLIDFEQVRADGYGFQVEMTYLTERAGGRIVEVPIEFRDRTLGRSKMSGRIVVEAWLLVTRWGLRDRVRRLRHSYEDLRARH